MKKFLSAALAVTLCAGAHAEGYQINTLSAKQEGMGHTGVALKLGAESMFFNPAGLGFSKKTLDLSGTLTGIKANASATTADGKKYETDNGVATPISVNASFKIYDNVQCGVAFYTPYGSSINWGDNWPGAVLNQKVNLKTYTIQPTFAWRITPKLSVGAGLMLSWGSVDLNKGLVTAEAIDGLLQMQGMPATFGNVTPASVNIKGTAGLALGVNLGVMYDINDKWTVGLNWRSKQMMKVKRGDATVGYANELAQKLLEAKLGLINNANFKAEMPMPQVLKAGVSYKPIDKLTLAFDVQYTNWKTYKQLDIEFDIPENLKEEFDQHLQKNYRDAWCFNLGAEYALTKRFDVRCGLMIDTTPVNDNYYNPETPGMTKIEPSVGFSFRPLDRLSIDFSFMYVAGLGKDGASVGYKNFVTQRDETFKADYRVHAFVPAIGISYGF